MMILGRILAITSRRKRMAILTLLTFATLC